MISLQNTGYLSQNVQKVDDDFYTGKIPDKDLWIVMERVNNANIKPWRRYAEIQTQPRLHDMVMERRDENGHLFQKGSLLTGSGHFNQVLESISCDVNEVWVAYITKAKTPEKIPNDMVNYTSSNVLERDHVFAKNIEMFVTITSSRNALITSHMGVACSLESVGNRSKGTSVDLHSFAARVMLIRNPERKYMVHAPVAAMEMIVAEALPGSFHAGTLEMQQRMKKRQSVTLEEFKDVITPNKSKKLLEIARINPNDRRVIKAEVMEDCSAEKKYHHYKNPYTFKPAINKEAEAEEFLKFMEKHPPILSEQKDRMVIFNPQTPSEPDITIEQGNKEYEWMRADAFKPVGSTHYVVVELPALATCKTLDSTP